VLKKEDRDGFKGIQRGSIVVGLLGSEKRHSFSTFVERRRVLLYIIKSRRHNILSQVYPEYLGLLDRDDIWSGGEDLFAQGFLKHLVEEA
jgi:hypothetical protein